MTRGSAKGALRQLQMLYQLGALGGLTDAELLELYLSRTGADAEEAFAALVHRPGPAARRVEGRKILLRQQWMASRSVTTDAKGRYQNRVGPGTYTLEDRKSTR